MADKKSSRKISYFNLGHEEFKRDLKNFAKVFFPDKSRDLSAGSSGEMMIEEASFVGDVLSFYLENRFRNSNIVTANDIESIYNLSRFLSHEPQGPRAARGDENFYIEVPATSSSTGAKVADKRYAFNFKNVKLQNNNGIVFEALEDINFFEIDTSSSLNVKVSKRDAQGSPTHFVLRTTKEVIAGQTKNQTVTITEHKPFREVEITEPNVLDVISVVDSDGDSWERVNFLAQEAIYETIVNNDADSDDVPFILKLKTVPKRFVLRTNPKTGKSSLIFGPGKATEVGTPFVPDPKDIALDLKGKLIFTPEFIDPQNFIRTRTLGLSPFNTTLTIRVRVGGGTITNTAQDTLTDIIGKEGDFSSAGLDVSEVNNTLNSFAANNTNPIRGGEEPETPREIKENASAIFAAQGRLNTREDYIARALSLPAKFGKIFRAYATPNCNPAGGVQLHVIAKDVNNKLSVPSSTLKKNLKNYFSIFTRLGQGIDILDGEIANIGIEYNIVVTPGVNKTQTKLATLKKVKDFFDVNNWQINQPIIIDDVRCLIVETENVIAISDIKFINKNNIVNGNQYSETSFDIRGNTKNGIIFPPVNTIFELKFPEKDILVGAI